MQFWYLVTPTSLQDQKDGTYSITFFPFVSGQFVYRVTVKSVEVLNSPFDLNLEPGPPLPFTFLPSRGQDADSLSCHPQCSSRRTRKGLFVP